MQIVRILAWFGSIIIVMDSNRKNERMSADVAVLLLELRAARRRQAFYSTRRISKFDIHNRYNITV